MEKYFNIVINDGGEITTADLMEVNKEQTAAKNCRENPAEYDDYYIIASSYEVAHGNLWGEKVGRRVTVC